MIRKVRTFIFALFIAVFFGRSNVSAVDIDNFYDFTNAIGAVDFDIRLTAPNYQWMQNLAINNNGIIRGGVGSILAVLDGGNSYQAFSVIGKTIDFYDNFEFKNFNYLQGAISGNISTIISFTNSVVNFISNTAQYNNAGAVYIDESNINFTSSTVNFTDNKAAFDGGAIVARESIVNFTSSAVNFTSNTAQYNNGGAVYIGNYSKFDLTNSTIHFINNKAGTSGGAIYTVNANTKFSSSAINFTSNTAGDNGGAIASLTISTTIFTNSIVKFISNTAGDNGGAIASLTAKGLAASLYFMYSIIDFIDNAAGVKGGAIFVENYSNFEFTSSTVNFVSNAAEQGGAIYGGESNINFTSSIVNFMSNTADDSGGVIYAIKSTISFVRSSAAFIDNIGGDIFLETSSLLLDNSQVLAGGGISAITDSNISISGGGLKVSEKNYFNAMASFRLENKSIFEAFGGTFTYINSPSIELINSSMTFRGSYSSITFSANGGAGGWDINLVENSHLNLDAVGANGRIIFNDGLRVFGGQITKKGLGIAEFNGDINLDTKFIVEAGTALFKSGAVYISTVDVKAGGILSFKNGAFNEMFVLDILIGGTLEIELGALTDIESDKVISSNTIEILEGSTLRVFSLTALPSEWEIVIASGMVRTGQFSSYDSNRYSIVYKPDSVILMNGQIVPILPDTDNNPNETALLFGLRSDRFIPQTIAQMAVKNPGISIYPHIKRNLVSWLDENRYQDETLYFHSLWAEAFISDAVIKERQRDIKFYKDIRAGIRAGINIIEDEFRVLGVFGSIERAQIKQGGHRANIDSFEGGGYGGVFHGIFKHKVFISLGMHEAKTRRLINFHGAEFRPESAFNLSSIKYGFESSAELPFYFKRAKTSLFIGGQSAQISNGKIKESGGDMMNLTIEGNSYKRIAGYSGIRVENSGWYADGRINYFFKGRNEESHFLVSWNDYGRQRSVDGANNDLISFGLNGGIEREIKRNVFLFAAVELEIGRDFYEQGMEMKGGIKYVFATRKSANLYRENLELINQQEQEQEREREREIEPQEEEIIQDDLIEQAQDMRENAKASYTFDNALFKINSAVLSPEAVENIREVSESIKGEDFEMIMVEGHTDSTGSEELNMNLSARRAKSVADELIRNGLPSEKIKTARFGYRMPVADNKTVEGRRQNRRVEIFVK